MISMDPDLFFSDRLDPTRVNIRPDPKPLIKITFNLFFSHFKHTDKYIKLLAFITYIYTYNRSIKQCLHTHIFDCIVH